jgi:hypothetical protein
MYNPTASPKTTLKVDKSYPAETLEMKIRRILNNKEPITDTAPLIYTERADGVQPQYDVRTDRMEIALDAMDVASKSHRAKREERHQLEQKAADKAAETNPVDKVVPTGKNQGT